MADLTQSEPQKVVPTRVKKFWSGTITTSRCYSCPLIMASVQSLAPKSIKNTKNYSQRFRIFEPSFISKILPIPKISFLFFSCNIYRKWKFDKQKSFEEIWRRSKSIMKIFCFFLIVPICSQIRQKWSPKFKGWKKINKRNISSRHSFTTSLRKELSQW